MKPPIEPKLLAKFEKHFKVDYQVYNFFKEELRLNIEAFGVQRMKQELAKMREVFANCDKVGCELKKTPKKRTSWSKVKVPVDYYLEQAESGYGQCPYSTRIVLIQIDFNAFPWTRVSAKFPYDLHIGGALGLSI